MNRKIEQPPSLTNLSTSESSTPVAKNRRDSLGAWQNDAMSILQKFPPNKYNQNQDHSGNSRSDISPVLKSGISSYKTLNDTKTKTGTKEFKGKHEASIGSIKTMTETSPDLINEKTTRRFDYEDDDEDDDNRSIINKTPKIQPKIYPQRVWSDKRIELEETKYKDNKSTIGTTFDPKNLKTPFGELPQGALKLYDFHPKLKPKQTIIKPKDFQNMGNNEQKSLKGTPRKAKLSLSPFRVNIFDKAEVKITDDKPINFKVGEEISHHLYKDDMVGLNKPSVSERKYAAKLKSFNNANLKFARKNFMGISMLSNQPNFVCGVKEKNFLDKMATDCSEERQEMRDEETNNIQIFRQYLDKITRPPNKNMISVFREKNNKSTLVSDERFTCYEKDTTEIEAWQESFKHKKVQSVLFEKKPLKKKTKGLDMGSSRWINLHGNIMIDNSIKHITLEPLSRKYSVQVKQN